MLEIMWFILFSVTSPCILHGLMREKVYITFPLLFYFPALENLIIFEQVGNKKLIS